MEWYAGQNAREWVLATWPDGGRLSRMPEVEDDRDASDPEVVLTYWKGEEYVAKLSFFHVRSADESHGTGMLQIEWDAMLSGIEAKICWFLFETTAPSYFRERVVDNSTLNDFLYLPQFLPDAFAVLDDHYLEVEAGWMSDDLLERIQPTDEDPEGTDSFEEMTDEEMAEAKQLFEKMEKLGLGEVGVFSSGPIEEEPCLTFSFSGQTYFVVHRPIRVTGREGAGERHRDRLRKKGTDAFAVFVDDVGEPSLVGSGRTVKGALLDVPFLVWPGQVEEWRKRLDPGTLTFGDLEVFFLLGDVVPCWWKTKPFEQWAKTAGLPTGMGSSPW